MIASTALELFVLGLAVWQLAVVRRSMRADRETDDAARNDACDPTGG